MKILQLVYESPGSPFGYGGAGVRAQEIYRRLSVRHEITLLYMKYPGAKDRVEGNLKHVFAGAETRSIVKSVIAYTLKASQFIKKNGREFDVIVENFLPCMPFCSPLLTKTPVILQVQGIMEKHAFGKYKFIYAAPMYIIEKFYPCFFDRFMFVSPVTQEQLLSCLDKKKVSAYMVPNGIDESLLETASEDEGYILFFSRIDRYQKGVDILLGAFEKIALKYPGLKLVLAGYQLDSVEGLLKEYPPEIQGRVEYAGFVTGKDKLRLLAGAKMFVLPSRYESQPISIIEAAACGKPVIVSDIPELGFVEKKGFGLSFPASSVETLQQKMELLLGNNEMRRHMGRKGREFAKQFSWDNTANEYEEALKDAAK